VFLAAGADDFNPVEKLYDREVVWETLLGYHGKAFIEGWNSTFPSFMHISQHVLMIWLATALLLGLFCYVTFARNTRVPRGLRNFIEPIVLFLRDQVVRPSINNPHAHHGDHGHAHGHAEKELPAHWLADKFVPFFVCMFFFIVTINLLGLIPGASVASTALTFTASMALITLLVYAVGAVAMSIRAEGGVAAGLKGFVVNMVPYKFSLKPMDLTVWLLLFMIEFAGFLLIKPFALAVRLFANMTAGNCSLMSFLFINLLIPDDVAYLRILTGLPTLLVGVALYAFEIFVSILQAYIFTYLSAIFLGLYLVPEH
jgi:F-type H+-transporting ATPase subunit a